MSYIWQDFNIKTFPAETVVFRDGLFCPELSTLDSPVLDKNYDLPVHYIYVGEISGAGNFDIIINENVKNQKVYLSAKIKVKDKAEINIIVKNSGFGTDLRGFFVIENHGNLTFNMDAYHLCRNTGILIKTRLLGFKDSVSKLSGTAHIYKYCEDCRSDMDFSAMADSGAKIIFSPQQHISAIPENAEHSASIAHYNPSQVEYLHQSGLVDTEVSQVLKEAFVNDINIIE